MTDSPGLHDTQCYYNVKPEGVFQTMYKESCVFETMFRSTIFSNEFQDLIDSNTTFNCHLECFFNDDRCANIFEALVGTLKAAKRKKIVNYKGELLLQGVHDDVDIVLLKDEE